MPQTLAILVTLLTDIMLGFLCFLLPINNANKMLAISIDNRLIVKK